MLKSNSCGLLDAFDHLSPILGMLFFDHLFDWVFLHLREFCLVLENRTWYMLEFNHSLKTRYQTLDIGVNKFCTALAVSVTP